MPLAPDDSLPGTFCHPLAVCHSHSSPFRSAFCSAAIPAWSPTRQEIRCDEPAVVKPADGIQADRIRSNGAADPGERRRLRTRVERKYFHRFAAAVEDDVERVNAIASFPQR